MEMSQQHHQSKRFSIDKTKTPKVNRGGSAKRQRELSRLCTRMTGCSSFLCGSINLMAHQTQSFCFDLGLLKFSRSLFATGFTMILARRRSKEAALSMLSRSHFQIYRLGSDAARALSTRSIHLGGGTTARPNVSFKVTRVSFADGATQTINLDSHSLLRKSSVYVRDLFFTLNLTTRKERKSQPKMMTRRSSSAILPRKDAIVVSFGNVRALISLQDTILFDAHDLSVQSFANELRHAMQPPSSGIKADAATSSMSDPEANTSTADPKELIVLELIIREGVDAFHRHLRLFEPIGTYQTTTRRSSMVLQPFACSPSSSPPPRTIKSTPISTR
jgi:hypothetical protein